MTTSDRHAQSGPQRAFSVLAARQRWLAKWYVGLRLLVCLVHVATMYSLVLLDNDRVSLSVSTLIVVACLGAAEAVSVSPFIVVFSFGAWRVFKHMGRYVSAKTSDETAVETYRTYHRHALRRITVGSGVFTVLLLAHAVIFGKRPSLTCAHLCLEPCGPSIFAFLK